MPRLDLVHRGECKVGKYPSTVISDAKLTYCVVIISACKEREWFTEYTPFKTFVDPPTMLVVNPGSPGTAALGIGTVDLPVRRSPTQTGKAAHGILRLHDVLHVPNMPANILARGIDDGPDGPYTIEIGGTDVNRSKGAIKNGRGQQVAYFTPGHLFFAVKLSGPPVGPFPAPSELRPNGFYSLGLHWPDSERARWNAYRSAQLAKLKGPATGDNNGQETRDVDMEGTEQQQQQQDAKNGGDSKNKRKRPVEQGPSYRDDYPLTDEEKDWLKKNYGGEFNFLHTHGLKMHDEEDREQGRRIVRAMMANSDDEE